MYNRFRNLWLLVTILCLHDAANARRLHLRGIEVLRESPDLSLVSGQISSAIPSSLGFRQPVVLDCAYEIFEEEEEERQSVINNNHLDEIHNHSSHDQAAAVATTKKPFHPVVKWFRNDETTPFYQWLSRTGSRTFHHAYLDFVDSFYKHNDVPHEMFRAVRIIHPTPELSGNFSCEVIDEDESEDSLQQLASHSLYIYDIPSPFELRLNFSRKELTCIVWTTEELSSVRLEMYKIDYDPFEMEVSRLRFNETIEPQSEPNSSHWKPIEASVILQSDDLKVSDVGGSRTFFCDVYFTRAHGLENNKSLVFQRSIRVVHEAPSDDENLEELLPEPQAWFASAASGFSVRNVFWSILIVQCVVFLYIP